MKCANCKFWRLIRLKKDGSADDWIHPHGKCSKITENNIENTAWLYSSFLYEDAGEDVEMGVDPSLITSPDFGCVLFEADKIQILFKAKERSKIGENLLY